MRRLLPILIVLSLSSITTAYACDMSGAVPQLACCCDAGEPDSCPDAVQDCVAGSMADAPDGGCCSIVVTSGTSANGVPETQTTRDLPPLSSLPAATAAIRPMRTGANAPRLRVDACSAPPIYLLAGRLRR